MIGGFFGGAAILTFIQPKSIGEAFIRGAVSTGSAMIFAQPVISWFKIESGWENELMSGFIVGFLAYSILGMIANSLIKYQNKGIIEAIKEVKND